MTHLSLFSGIGGLDLASEWAGFKTIQMVEREPYCQKVLAKNFPGVPIHDDVCTFGTDHIDSLGYATTRYWEERMAHAHSKYDNAVKLYYELKSISKVAEQYGVTRQAMHDILKRRGAIFYPQLKFGEDNHFYRGGVNAIDAAQNKLEQAIKYGRIARPDVCEKCGQTQQFKDGRTGIQAHHYDYEKPLDVIWLCQKCHHNLHKDVYLSTRKEVSVEAAPSITVLSGGFP